MRAKWGVVVIALAAVGLGGCLDRLWGWHYDQTKTGTLKGTLQIRWLSQDTFLFSPDPADPLVFTRSDGTSIQPQTMYTDGGTIPLALRAIKAYSPWGYAPAYIIHDWLFVMKQCKLKGYETWTLDDAANVMSEAIKTLMEKPDFGGPNKLVHYSMYEAVRSKTAQDYWDNGKCNAPGAAMQRTPAPGATRSLGERSADGSTPPMPTITIKIK
ncbi:MAG: hypothetical protein AB7E80_13645 [Hyphomicrobiaceae bacterium]